MITCPGAGVPPRTTLTAARIRPDASSTRARPRRIRIAPRLWERSERSTIHSNRSRARRAARKGARGSRMCAYIGRWRANAESQLSPPAKPVPRLQLGAEELLHRRGVGPSLGALQDLADEGVDDPFLASTDLLDEGRIGLDHLVHDRLQLGAVANRGEPMLLDEQGRVCGGILDHQRVHLLADRA